jgi:hypothetical protein
VKFIDLAFRLGVVFAIFGFIWGIFKLIVYLITNGKRTSITEEYIIKFIQYFFLVDVTFLFCVQKEDSEILMLNELILSGLILLIYFVGKLQNKQNQISLFKGAGGNFKLFKPTFNLKAEILIITLSLLLFVGFIFFPSYAQNPISFWFYDSILNIESTPIFGFIFKVIGFFVLLSILFKMISGILYILSGRPLLSVQTHFHEKGSSKDDFDDFEELK